MNILASVKWGAIGVLGLGIMFGIYKLYDMHVDAVEEAVSVALLKADADAQEQLLLRENNLREEARLDRQRIEKELAVEKGKVKDLQKMLLIEHDLDRLLQEKPGLILTRVNKGTEEVLKELEEITQ